jgi:hypothetical protein
VECKEDWTNSRQYRKKSQQAPIKERVKRKNTSPVKKNILFFYWRELSLSITWFSSIDPHPLLLFFGSWSVFADPHQSPMV